MKTLETLIRLAKLEVDDRRRVLAELLDRDAAFDRAIARLDQEVEDERERARQNPEYATGYAAYVRHSADRRKALVDDKAKLSQEILKARDDLAAAFEEQKKFEITAENQAKEETAEMNRLEQAELDALGLQSHRREQSGQG